jgi:hypothetical protein
MKKQNAVYLVFGIGVIVLILMASSGMLNILGTPISQVTTRDTQDSITDSTWYMYTLPFEAQNASEIYVNATLSGHVNCNAPTETADIHVRLYSVIQPYDNTLKLCAIFANGVCSDPTYLVKEVKNGNAQDKTVTTNSAYMKILESKEIVSCSGTGDSSSNTRTLSVTIPQSDLANTDVQHQKIVVVAEANQYRGTAIIDGEPTIQIAWPTPVPTSTPDVSPTITPTVTPTPSQWWDIKWDTTTIIIAIIVGASLVVLLFLLFNKRR